MGSVRAEVKALTGGAAWWPAGPPTHWSGSYGLLDCYNWCDQQKNCYLKAVGHAYEAAIAAINAGKAYVQITREEVKHVFGESSQMVPILEGVLDAWSTGLGLETGYAVLAMESMTIHSFDLWLNCRSACLTSWTYWQARRALRAAYYAVYDFYSKPIPPPTPTDDFNRSIIYMMAARKRAELNMEEDTERHRPSEEDIKEHRYWRPVP
jgi:hypothetical protein